MAELWLTEDQQKAMVAHALAEAPNEACGLLLGTPNHIKQVLPTRNIAANPSTKYRVDDADVVRHYESIIGVYHSHPNNDPIPSRTDIQESWYSETVYVIIGLKGPQARLAAWRFYNGRVESVTLRTGNPAYSLAQIGEPKFTRAQKVAIILGAAIILIMMLILSVVLLPPPPPIL